MSTIEGGSFINRKKFLDFAGTTIGQVPYYIRTSPAAAPLLCDARNLCVTFFPAKTGFQGWIFVVGHPLSIATVPLIKLKFLQRWVGTAIIVGPASCLTPAATASVGDTIAGERTLILVAGAVGVMRGRALRLKMAFQCARLLCYFNAAFYIGDQLQVLG